MTGNRELGWRVNELTYPSLLRIEGACGSNLCLCHESNRDGFLLDVLHVMVASSCSEALPPGRHTGAWHEILSLYRSRARLSNVAARARAREPTDGSDSGRKDPHESAGHDIQNDDRAGDDTGDAGWSVVPAADVLRQIAADIGLPFEFLCEARKHPSRSLSYEM